MALRLICAVLMTLVFSACSVFMEEPKVILKQTSIVGFDSGGVDVEFYLGVTNPNSFDLSLTGYTYNLRVMTLPLASGGSQNRIVFTGKQETDMLLPIRVRYSDLYAIIKRGPNPDMVPYLLNAQLHMAAPTGSLTIPVTRSGVFSVPDKYRPATYLNYLQELLSPPR